MTEIFHKFYIKTYGCQMNVADSELIASHLARLGLNKTEAIAEADIVILNTCSVRQLPEQKAYSFLGRAEPFKKLNPSLKIIVVGCMAQRAAEQIKRRFPIVDLVVGAKDIAKFPEFFIEEFGNFPAPMGDLIGQDQLPKTALISEFVTIMRGCENFCSYCIVPFVRGPEVSRPAGEILKEIEALVKNGVKEVTLLGQNVNSYRDSSEPGAQSSPKERTDFPKLLKSINSVKGIERVRFMTSHPKDLSDELIDAMAELPKVCEHLHLPLQSGSDAILKEMNRGYTSSDYLKMVHKIRKVIPGINITTDILIGFPGETEKDLNDTAKLIEDAAFDSLFAFKYSPRPGTRAALLSDNVTLTEKDERLKRVLDLGDRISREKNAKLIDSVHEILVDSTNGVISEGRTRSNKKVSFPSEAGLAGKTLNVRITEVKVNSLAGKIEKAPL